MFGDKLLLGKFDITVDKARRIILPPKTCREKDDYLALIFNDLLDVYEIYKASDLINVFYEMRNLALTAKSDNDRETHSEAYISFGEKVKGLTVDAQGRVTLGEPFLPQEQIELIGVCDHLILKRKK